MWITKIFCKQTRRNIAIRLLPIEINLLGFNVMRWTKADFPNTANSVWNHLRNFLSLISCCLKFSLKIAEDPSPNQEREASLLRAIERVTLCSVPSTLETGGSVFLINCEHSPSFPYRPYPGRLFCYPDFREYVQALRLKIIRKPCNSNDPRFQWRFFSLSPQLVRLSLMSMPQDRHHNWTGRDAILISITCDIWPAVPIN
jgi:hypothetical protein